MNFNSFSEVFKETVDFNALLQIRYDLTLTDTSEVWASLLRLLLG